MKKQTMHRIFLAFAALGLLLTTPLSVQAQGLFSPAIRVNDRAITNYELEQRILMMQALNSPGDLEKEARKQLIEDRLKLDAATAVGVKVTEEMIAAGTKEFAGRANLEPEKFFEFLASRDVARQSFQDFLFAGLAWR